MIGTLLIATLLLTLAFTTAAMSFSHYTLSNQIERAAVARSLAEAAANRAIGRCLADITYGARGSIGDDITVTMESVPGGWGKVYFGGQDSVRFGNIPRSYNYLAQDIPQPGNGRTLPSRSLQIIAIGQSGKMRRAVETIVAIPQYKYAIASTGNITASGGLLVAGVKNPAAVENGVSLIPEDQWAPGCVLSNSADPEEALNLDSGAATSRITGDVRAAGGIKLGANTTVEGSLKAFASPEEVPKVDPRNFDTASMAGCNTTLSADEFNLEINGPARREGNLTVSGGLTMDAGVLYVNGDVEVHGGLHGKGALISTGQVRIYHQSSFKAADDQAAIVAQSNVEIHGSDQDDCVYNGVVFTQGDFKASKVTLLGALCAARTEGSKVELTEVNLLTNPLSMDLNYSITGMLAEHVAGARRYWYEAASGMTPDGKVIDPAALPPIAADTNNDGRMDLNGDHNIGMAVDRYGSNSWLMSIKTNPTYEQSVKRAYNRADASQQYSLLNGNPDYCRYNSDFSQAWDPAANGGKGGFTLEKYGQAFPLGVIDGNGEFRLTDVVYEDKPGWAFADDFSARTLYQAIRGQQTASEPLQKYRLVNQQTGEVRSVTFAEVFNPGGTETPAQWGATNGADFLQSGLNSHMSIWKEQNFDWMKQVPAPLEPWNDPRFIKELRDPNDAMSLYNGTNAVYRWLNSQTTFNKLRVEGAFNFNPLQFIQLRDQSQRLMWREFDPGSST